MPKTTFFNLDEAKRKKIQEAAIKEFAAYGFHGARLNNIVAKAGIAKGSFYQYFEDMEDLFFHLIESMTKEKMSYISREISRHKEAGFFEKIKITMRAGMGYAKSLNEETRHMIDHLPSLKMLNTERLARLRKEYGEAHYYPLIDAALEAGKISADRDFVFAVIANAGRMIVTYLRHTLGTGHIDEILMNDKKIDKAIDLFVDFIKAGLLAQKDEKEK